MANTKAAIPADEILSRSLAEISAAEFVQLLGREDLVDRRALAILPDKKKYELWIDEDVVLKRPIGDILVNLRTEKKKIELEKYKFEDVKLAIEDVVNPADRLVDPALDRARLVEDIANAVAQKLRV